MHYDVIAFGIHPDDLEIGIFGTLCKCVQDGKKVLLVDLTAGEMGSNGNPEIRRSEALRAAERIGADRVCLGLPDRGVSASDRDQLNAVIRCIRQHTPDWVLYPYWKDYHPDHENGSRLIREAIHSSGLTRHVLGATAPHRPGKTACYYINDVENPNLYVDISEVIEVKKQALAMHESQFARRADSVQTYLNDGFIEKVMTRDAYLGMCCKTRFAEALFLHTPPLVSGIGGVLL